MEKRDGSWVYNGELSAITNVYTYLGFFFLSAQLCFAFSCKDLASRAKNALLAGMQKLRMFHNNSFVLLIKLFDSQIQPIIQYGAEIWK